MKAAQINKYGGSEVVEINKNTPKPAESQGQLLVEVCADFIAGRRRCVKRIKIS